MKSTDLMVVLAGARGSRVEKAAELFHQGVSDKILFTGGTLYLSSDAQMMKEYALSLGLMM